MRLTSPVAIVDFVESRVRQARIARQNARLRRELARLPRYIARDIGVGPDQDRLINPLDD